MLRECAQGTGALDAARALSSARHLAAPSPLSGAFKGPAAMSDAPPIRVEFPSESGSSIRCRVLNQTNGASHLAEERFCKAA